MCVCVCVCVCVCKDMYSLFIMYRGVLAIPLFFPDVLVTLQSLSLEFTVQEKPYILICADHNYMCVCVCVSVCVCVNTYQNEDHPLENTPTDQGPADNVRTYTRVLGSIILLWASLMPMNNCAKFHVRPQFDCNV